MKRLLTLSTAFALAMCTCLINPVQIEAKQTSKSKPKPSIYKKYKKPTKERVVVTKKPKIQSQKFKKGS